MDEIQLQTKIVFALDTWLPNVESMVANSVAQALKKKSDRAFFDLVKPIDDCSIIALEIKVNKSFVSSTPDFKSGNTNQQRVLQAAFEAGVPIFYCYNYEPVVTNHNALQCFTALPNSGLGELAILNVSRFSSSRLRLKQRVEEVRNEQSATGIGGLIACGAIAHDKNANIKGLIFLAASNSSIEVLDPAFVEMAFKRYCSAFGESPGSLDKMKSKDLNIWFLKMKSTARSEILAAIAKRDEEERQRAEDSPSSGPRMS